MSEFKLDENAESLPVALAETDIPGLKLLNRGKVRDIYDLGDKLMIITTDRISAFDVVLSPPITDKGRALTQISLFWFELFKNIMPNHMITDSLDGIDIKPELRRHLEGRTMIVKKAKPLPVECIARGYIVGSGWKEYQKSGTVCGIDLPEGLELASQLPEPIFTPSTKAEIGDHDENISYEKMVDILGEEMSKKVRDLTLKLYTKAAEYAREKGIIIADTKFEFGEYEGELILIDEALTPDSSRFWPVEQYATGANPPSFDKQFVRDWLETTGWDKTPPAPVLPAEVVQKTRDKYIEAYTKLTGSEWKF